MLTGLVRSLAGTVGAPLAILIVFLGIVGLTLYLTPRIAKWLDKNDKTHRGYYDGMLTEDPNKANGAEPNQREEAAGSAKAPKDTED